MYFLLNHASLLKAGPEISDIIIHAINPYLPSGLFHPYQVDESISIFRGGWCTFFIFILFLIEIPLCEDCCVLRRLIWVCTVCICPRKRDARLIWVNVKVI